MNGARYFGRGGPNASWDGDDAGGGEQQQQHPMRRNVKSGGNLSDNIRDNNNNNNRKNNSWSVQPELSSRGTPNPYYPPQFNRRISTETGLNTLHSGSTVKHNNSSNRLQLEGYDTDVSNNAPAHHIRRNSDDVGAARPRSSSYEANNTARIIAERKRRSSSAEMGMNHRPIRRVNTAGDLNAMVRKRRLSMNAGIQQQNAGRPAMRRVNTAGDLQMLDGKRAIARNKRPSWNGNMQMPPGQATGRPIRRNSTAGDLRAVEEHAIFRRSNVSDIHDEFTDTHQQYKPVSTRRRNPSNTSNRSNEDIYPSGVAGRRRTIGDRNSRRRSSRTSSGNRSSYDNNPQSGSASDDNFPWEEGNNDFHQQLEQLRIKHRQRQAQQQQQSPRRRSSSMSGSLNSIDLEHEMAIMSAPLGVGLSTYAQNPNQQNPNQEMGELFREMQQLEMKSVDKSQNSWYLGRDASRDPSHHGSDLGPLGASHHSNKYSAKGSAYSAVGSAVASDRTNDERLFHALLNGKGRGNGKLRWHEKHSLSKRTIFIAVGLIVIAVAILGVVLALSPTDGSKKDGSGVSVNATNPSASVNYVVEPPSDIAGRCSPSNLPGSIPACLEACYPASCCYNMSDIGNKCWDINDPKSIKACKQYRPYCDIFHDPWEGATDGVLRTPPLNLVPICQQLYGKSEEGSSRLRGRGLLVGTADDMCEQYCEASKCCKAATISHPYAAGLELSASGVYTDAITKDYVVTNCQDDLVYQKNRNLCAEYDKFCKWEDVEETQKSEAWTSRPTMDPASSMTPSISPSILPSTSPSFSPEPSSTPTVNVFNMDWSIPTTMSPSTSFSPSQKFKPSSQPSLSSMPTIPIANITVIEDVCSGADNIALLANGNEAARAKCLEACTHGLCCYTEQLGYGFFIESCNAGNEAICEGYKACLWLQQSGALSLETLPDTSINATTNSTTTSNVNITNFDLPAITTNIFFNETSVTNASTNINDGNVTQATNSSSLSNETIIFNFQNPMTNEDTSSTNLSFVNDTIQTNTTASDTVPAALIPPPPSDLAALCALNGRFCGEVCKDVSCCFESTNNCSAIDEDVCRAYAPCSVLYQQGT